MSGNYSMWPCSVVGTPTTPRILSAEPGAAERRQSAPKVMPKVSEAKRVRVAFCGSKRRDTSCS